MWFFSQKLKAKYPEKGVYQWNFRETIAPLDNFLARLRSTN